MLCAAMDFGGQGTTIHALALDPLVVRSLTT